MGSLQRSLIAGFALILWGQAILPVPARAAPDAAADLKLFAGCAGRLSALREHQWLTDPAASERTEAMRQDMLSLVEATAGAASPVVVMHWRIEAKAAHAALLARALFQRDAAAARMARGHDRQCAALLGQS